MLFYYILYFSSFSLFSCLSMTDYFYIHIPFCRQRCPYCKFALTPVFDEFKKRRYIEYLKKEIREYSTASLSFCEFWVSVSEDFRETSQTVWATASFWDLENQTGNRCQNEAEESKTFDTFDTKSMENCVWKKQQKTIYFWWWTPSVLSHDETREILECFPFYRESDIEITMEMNPEDVTPEYIEWVLALGINRISLWVQTLDEVSLKEIHRSDPETIFRALENMKESNISLNIDFILGLPYTKPWETLAGIRELHVRFPYITHTSVYMLEDEAYPKHWRANSITEDEMQREFLDIMDYFDSIGWHQYELSNFAKPGYASIHNQAYWDHSETRGFGLSAASYECGRRWNNSSSFAAYYRWKRENEEILTPEQIEIEKMMFGLRRDGWEYNTRSIQIDKLISDWLIEVSGNQVKPIKTWIFVIDHILSELVSDF